MAGAYSATDMAAVAVGTSIWLPAILFGHGLLLALTPVIAQLNGAGRRDRIAHQVRQGFWLASGVSVLLIVVLYNCKFVIDMMHNIDPQLADKAVGYLHAIMWGSAGLPVLPGDAQPVRRPVQNQARHGDRLPRPAGEYPDQLHLHLRQVRHAGAGWRRLWRRHRQRLLDHVPDDALVREARALAARHQTPGRRSRRPRLGGAEALDRHRHAGGAGAVLRSHAVRRGGAAGFAAGDRCGRRPPDRA